jgi:hypothetical protein
MAVQGQDVEMCRDNGHFHLLYKYLLSSGSILAGLLQRQHWWVNQTSLSPSLVGFRHERYSKVNATSSTCYLDHCLWAKEVEHCYWKEYQNIDLFFTHCLSVLS